MALRIAESIPEGAERQDLIAVSLAEADAAGTAAHQRASGLSWSANLRMQLAASGHLDRESALKDAGRALDEASRIDPYNFQHQAQLARLAAQLGDSAQARVHASRALELEQAARLDPLRRMDDRTRLEIERLAAEPPR
jgi:hypothetical protein